MTMFLRVAILVLLCHPFSQEVRGFGLGGGGFNFRPPARGPVSLTPVNGSTRWGDILQDTAQQALDHCKAVRLCNTSGLFSFGEAKCSQCHPCSCHDSCYSRKDCCIDKQLRDLSRHPVLEPPPAPSPSPLPTPSWGCHDTFVTHYDLARHVFMLDSCPPSWQEEETARRCLTPPPNETFSRWPVWAPRSDAVYRNVHCARCQGEDLEHLLRWNLKVACDRSVYLSHSPNVLEAMEKALEEPTCQIFFVPPAGCTPSPCRPVEGRYIDSCNVTGQRDGYDQTLWTACETFHGAMTTGGDTYKNVFCAMCNLDRMSAPGMCPVDVPFPFFLEMEGSSFRGLPDREGSGHSSCACADTEVYDQFEDRCRPLQCSMTRQLHQGRCRSIVTNSSGIFYDLALSLTPADPTQPVLLTGTGPLTRVARNIRTAFLLQGSHTTGWQVTTHRFRVIAETEAAGPNRPPGRNRVGGSSSSSSSRSSSIQDTLRVLRFKVHIQFCSTWPESSEALEGRLFALMRSQWSFAVEGYAKQGFNASPVYLVGPQKEEDDDADGFRHVSLLSSEGRFKEFVVDIPDPHIESHGGELLETNYYLPISEALKCARVSFNVSASGESEKAVVTVNKTSGSVHHLPSDKVISFQYVEIGQDGEIAVCADQLFDGSVGHVRPDFPVQFFTAQLFVITVSCQALSVFCLVLVLVTYVTFAELRTMAGKNLLGLVSTLSLAIALTGASVFGVGSSTGCLVLGIAGHFFLLSAFTWALLGLFHSYHLFHSSAGCWLDRRLNEPHTFNKYLLVSLLVPALVVGTTVVSNVLDSREDCVTDLGYGRNTCFVSSYSGFLLTLCLSVLVMVSSVALALWALRQRRRLAGGDRGESFRQHFRHLVAQAVLGVLVAGSAVLQLLALVADRQALWYAALLLHAGLALYILLVFLCKKQTLKLWSGCFGAAFVCGQGRPHGHKFSPVET